MNVTLENINPTTAKISVAVGESDYKEKFDKELKEISRTHTIPGFRKGHVPMGQLLRMFGKQVKSDILNHEVFNAVVKYLQENKVNVLGEPMPVEVKEISLDCKDYNFEYEIGLAPEFNITLDKSLVLPYYVIKIDDEMKARQNEMLRERFGSQQPGETVEPRAIVKGVMMELDAEGKVKETEDAIQVTSAIVAPFLFKDNAEADKFMDKKVGDKVVFNPAATCDSNAAEMASMLNIDKNRAAEVKSDFEFVISEIIVNRLAELGQEFYDEVFGKGKVTTEEDYNKAVEAMIASQLAPNSEQLFAVETEKELIKKFGNVELPVEFLKKWLIARNEELNADNIDAAYADMENSIKWQLIKEQIIRNAEIKIEEDDVLNFAKSIAASQFAQYGMTNIDDETVTDYAKRILADKNSRSHIIEEVGNRKLFNAIKNLAEIETKEVSLDEFKKVAEEIQKA